ncbi:MAG TPA: DUF4199 domain-containing protein [Draconibacterium sp.]|nr:DUF4199 domain-containing protein [Draconibacterium sp.]HRX10875.1 DUF4199 domain-containing protein [Draconibacterium sp.]
MEEKSTSIWKSSLTYGAYMALISIAISVIIWAGGLIESMGIFGSAIIGLLSFVITFLLLLFFTKAYRNKELNGIISFKQAFQFAMLVVIFSVLITTIYNYIFHTLIDPEYMKNLMAVLQQKTMNYMEKVGAPEAQIEKTLEKFSEIPTIWKTLRQGIVTGLIAGAVISLIVAAIVKKKEEDIVPE